MHDGVVSHYQPVMAERACPSCGEANPGRARFCLACGTRLEAETRASRRTVTVLFADLAGSTAIGERLDPESTRALMERLFESMRAVVELHGGRVEKYIGDAVMAVFGVPRAHEDDALRAVKAALELQQAVAALSAEARARWGVELFLRVGVNTGEVVLSDGTATGPQVVGDPVNVAARLQQAAAPGQVLLGEDTSRLVRAAVVTEEVGPLTLKGKRLPVGAYRALRLAPERRAGRPRRAPLVGRATEYALLDSIVTRSTQGHTCHLLTVLGVAGIGKSRLVAEVLEHARRHMTVLAGRCLPYGEGITYWPAAEIVRRAAGITTSDPPARARARVAELVGDAPEATDIAARLGTLLGLDELPTTTEETLWSFRRFVELLAARAPVALVFDDLHWAEPGLLDLIEHVAERMLGAPVLIVCLARPELLDQRPAWGAGRANAVTLALEPLDEERSAELGAHLLGGGLAPALAARLAEVSGGNPLFVEELLAMLVEQGALTRSGSSWDVTAPLDDMEIPPTIGALLAARLDHLEDDERELLEHASVIGKQFAREELEHLCPQSLRARLGSVLDALVRREIVRPDPGAGLAGESYSFRHILLRDAAYQGLPKRMRAHLHEAYARQLEGSTQTRAADIEEFAGYHLEQAAGYIGELGDAPGDHARLALDAARHLAAAGRRALARGEVRAACNLLERAAELLPGDHPERAELLIALGEALLGILDLPRAQQALDDAVACSAGRQRSLQARALTARMFLELTVAPAGRVEEIGSEANDLLHEIEGLGDDLALARLWFLLSQVQMIKARAADCRVALERTVHHAARAGDLATEYEAYSWLTIALLYGPAPADEGAKICAEVIDKSGADRRVASLAQVALGALRAMQGEIGEGRQLCAEARARLRDLGHLLTHAHTAQSAALIELLAGDPSAAERVLSSSYAVLERGGEKGFSSSHAAMLAHACYLQGRYDDAERYALLSENVAGDEDITAHVEARAVRAKVMARRGELAVAAVMAREASELAQTSDFLQMTGLTLCDEAEVLALAGNHEGAAALRRQALLLFEQKGDVVDARRTAALLT